jgi:26S proteasome regulatory subunit N1
MAASEAPPAEKPEDKAKPKNAKDADPDADLSDEDRVLKERLELLVDRARDGDQGLAKVALESIRVEIRSATSSMTSVPKPLKFLRPHFPALKEHYLNGGSSDAGNAKLLADIISVLAMTMGNEELRETLHFKLRGTDEAPHLWGHEYNRFLAGEIAREYEAITVPQSTVLSVEKPATVEQLNRLVDEIVPFFIRSNAEPDAVDLLTEVDGLAKLPVLADEHNYARICRYLKACASFTPDADDTRVLLTAAVDIYTKVNRIPDAVQVALRLGDVDRVKELYVSTPMPSPERVQIALDIGAGHVPIEEEVEEDDALRGAMNNRRMFEYFQHLAKDLDVLEPKVPEDIYKTHLIDSRAAAAAGASDSARANLASTFVNAFVNLGFGTDKLLSNAEKPWIYSNKDHGMMSAAASLGMIMQWDVDNGLSEIDKYMYAEREYVRAGALLSVGIVSAGLRHEVDPALALLQEHVESEVSCIRNGAISGLGIAYAGTSKEEVKELLVPILANPAMPADSASLAALSLGLVFVGTADEDLSATLLQALSDRKDSPQVATEAMLPTLMPLALGFLFLGKQEAVEVVSQTIEAMVGVDTLLGRVTAVTLEACAYAGSGNVLKIQKLLGLAGEHHGAKAAAAKAAAEDVAAATPTAPTAASATPTAGVAVNGAAGTAADESSEDAEKASQEAVRSAEAEQLVAVLGIAMIAMGEELGSEMSIRAFGHLMQYGDAAVRRVVPLALGLLSVSHPEMLLVDSLSKYSHDQDLDVANSAIFALGLCSAGTNNSRVAGLLRQLSAYYAKEPSALFVTRLAQGLLHAGKGLVTLNPYYGDGKFLSSKLSLSGVLTVLFSMLDAKGTILGKSHFLLYFLSLSVRPRMVFTVDENMEFISTTVRVGQAVDVVGAAGRARTITGSTVHSSPVLLSHGERCELATDQYMCVAASMEGLCVLKANPDWVDDAAVAAVAAAEKKAAKAEAKPEAIAGPSS